MRTADRRSMRASSVVTCGSFRWTGMVLVSIADGCEAWN